MLENIIGVVLGGFILYGLEHDGILEALTHKKIRDYNLNDVLLVIIAIGGVALFFGSLFRLI